MQSKIQIRLASELMACQWNHYQTWNASSARNGVGTRVALSACLWDSNEEE